MLSGWAGGPEYLHKKTNNPISEQVGIQSLYCQGPLPVLSPPLSKPAEKPQPGSALGRVWGELCALSSGLGSANREGTWGGQEGVALAGAHGG